MILTSGGLLIVVLKLVTTFLIELLPPKEGTVGVPALPDLSDELIESRFCVTILSLGDNFLSYHGVNNFTFSELSFLSVGSCLTIIDRFSLYSIDIAALFSKVPPGKSFSYEALSLF